MVTKVKAKDIKNQAFLTTGTAPNYEITIPREFDYAGMDRMNILVNFHTAGSGSITLNVNGYGAKELKDREGNVINEIFEDDYFSLVFDESKDCFEVIGGMDTGGGYIVVGSPRDITSATHTQSYDLTPEILNGRSLEFNNNGTKVFVTKAGTRDIYEYTLSTPRDITSATYTQNMSLFPLVQHFLGGINIDSTGTHLLVLAGLVYNYTLSTPRDITSATLQGSFILGSGGISDICRGPNGESLYAIDTTNDVVVVVPLGSPRDLSSPSSASTKAISEDNTLQGMFFRSDFSELYLIGDQNDKLYKYTLSTPGDINTITYDSELLLSSLMDSPRDVFIKPDGIKMYINGYKTGIGIGIYEFVLETIIGGSTDQNAIHKNIAGEINSLTEKTNPVNADEIIIEDSEDGYSKKKVKFENLPAGSSPVQSVNSKTGNVVLDTSDIGDTTDKRYMTEAEKTKLGNQSGTNTGDQDLSTLALKTNVLEKTNTTSFTPTANYHPATKKYVDDNAGSGGAVSSVNGQTGAVVLDTGDIDEVTDKNYVTDAEKTVLGNTSNINSGDQDLSTLALKTNVLEKTNTTSFTPTANYHPATKKYVDDNIGSGGGLYNVVTTAVNLTLGSTNQVVVADCSSGSLDITLPAHVTGKWFTIKGINIDNIANTWSLGAVIPTATSSGSVASYGNKIYLIGGVTGGSYLNTNRIYDIKTNTWSTGASMPTARTLAYCGMVGTKIYVIGGANGSGSLNINEIYDTETNTWSTGASMPTARHDGVYCGVVGTKIYVIGGANGSTEQDVVEIYDTETNTWSTGASMPTARRALTVTAIGTKIYAIGGITPAVSYKTEIYDTETNTWSTGKDVMGAIGNLAGCGVIRGEILIPAEGKKYLPETNTWSTIPTIPAFYQSRSVISVLGKLYVIGGFDGGSVNNVQILDYTITKNPVVIKGTIDGLVDVNILNENESITIISDGTNYRRIGKF